MRARVYISDWQIQCCGGEFAVGGEISWPVAPVVRSDSYWQPLLGPELAAELTGHYQAHEDEMPPYGLLPLERSRSGSAAVPERWSSDTLSDRSAASRPPAHIGLELRTKGFRPGRSVGAVA